MQFDEERVIDFGQDSFFSHDVLLLVLLYDILFLEHFQSIQLVISLVSD